MVCKVVNKVTETYWGNSRQCLSDSCVRCIQMGIYMCNCLGCLCIHHHFCMGCFCIHSHPHCSADLHQSWTNKCQYRLTLKQNASPTLFRDIKKLSIVQIHTYLAIQWDTDRCKMYSLLMCGTLLPSHMAERHRDSVLPHNAFLFGHWTNFENWWVTVLAKMTLVSAGGNVRSLTCEWWDTLAHVTVDTVYASALV